NPTLDPFDPNYRWKDEGPVMVSALNGNPERGIRGNWVLRDEALRNDRFNAIDPGPVVDGDRLWLSFGSYWTGIYLVPLDPATGRRKPGDGRVFRVADYDADANHVHAIEAPYIERHGDYYYLFVNWDYCCR